MKKFYSIFVLSLLALLGMSARAANIYINIDVDVAERVAVTKYLAFMGTTMPSPCPLVDGLNEDVQITAEQPMDIRTSSEDFDLVSVSVNGVEQDITDPHLVTLFMTYDMDGANIVIRTAEAGTGGGEVDPPVVEKCAVSFEFADDNARNYIDFVVAADVPVDNWEAGFEVDPGTYIAININSSVQNVKIYANDVEQEYNSLTGNYIFQINEATVVRAESFVPEPDPTYTINVDNAAAVEVGYKVNLGWMTQTRYLSLTDGENVFTLDGTYSNIFINAKEGYSLNVKVNGTEVTALDNIAVSRDMVIDITTSEVVVEKAHLTLKCDDYTRVNVSMGMTVYELTSNEQQLEFVPGEDAVFVLNSVDAANPIISVSHNGNDVAGSGFGSSKSYYIFGAQDGDVVEVVTIPEPKTMYTVSFNIENEEAQAYITRVEAEGAAIENWAEGFEAEELALITLTVNPDIKNVKIKVDGVEKTPHALFNTVTFNLYDNTTVELYTVVVEPDPTFTIDVDNAAAVTVFYRRSGYPPMPVYLTLVDGENTITMEGGTMPNLNVIANEDYTLVSVMVDGVEVENAESIPVVANMVLSIITKKNEIEPIPDSIRISVNVDDASRVKVGYKGSEDTENEQEFDLVDGENLEVSMPNNNPHIYVRPASSESTVVSVSKNDEELPAGGYEFIPVEAGDHIVIVSDKTDAVRAIMGGAANVDVYSINGVKLMNNADAQQVRNLAPGLYIINGKKVIKK